MIFEWLQHTFWNSDKPLHTYLMYSCMNYYENSVLQARLEKQVFEYNYHYFRIMQQLVKKWIPVGNPLANQSTDWLEILLVN